MESTFDLIDNTSVFDVIQVEPELPVSHSSSLFEEPSEFEINNVPSPDSPFGFHLFDNDEDTSQMKNTPACPNIEDNLTEKSHEHLSVGMQRASTSPEVSGSPVNDEDDAILFSSAFNAKSQSSPKIQEATSSDKRYLLNSKDISKSAFSSSSSSSDTDEEPFSSEMPICPVLVLSESPSNSPNSVDWEEEEKSMDPLALPSTSAGLLPRKSPLPADQLKEPSSSKVRPSEAEKPVPSLKPLKKLSMRGLQVNLARASNCNEKDATAINLKATATINELKQQSNDMLSVYAKLKQENHELFLAKKKLAGNIDDMPVLVPSMYSVVTFDPNYSDGEIVNEVDNDSGILDATVEPYKDSYDAPDQISFESELASGNNNCGHSFCRFGSLCEGLHSKKNPPEHCGHSNCMLEPRCIQPDKPPPKGTSRIITPTDEYYTKSKGKQPIRAPSNVSPSTKVTPKPGIRLPAEASGDVKLKQKCSVRLFSLKMPSNPPADKAVTPVKNLTPVDPEQSTSAADNFSSLRPTPALPEAAISRRCFINLERLQTTPNVRVYCMVHSKYQCKCLKRNANSNKRKRGN